MNKSELIDKIEKAMPYVAIVGASVCISYGMVVSKYLGAKQGAQLLLDGVNDIVKETGDSRQWRFVNDHLFKCHVEEIK